MASPGEHSPGVGARFRAIAGYASVCLAIGAVVAGIVIALVDERDLETALPPVRETQLVKAVRAGGCELRRTPGRAPLGSSVPSTAAAPAQPRFYEQAPSSERLSAALRRGVIVISYRPGLDPVRVQQLRLLQMVIPTGTIVAPHAIAMVDDVAVAAYRRLLRCKRFTEATIDAIRLFRGRFIGTGPER